MQDRLKIECELNAKGNTFTFCDHASYFVSTIVQRSVLNGRLLFLTSSLDHGAYGVRALKCTLYVRQKCVNSPLIYSFPLSVTRISGIPNFAIQRSNKSLSALLASFLFEGWSTKKCVKASTIT